MFAKLLTFLYKLTYYFSPPSEINLDCEDNNDYDLTGQRLTHMSQITKYFIWRKYSLYLLIPFSLINIILNITNFFSIKKNILYYQKHKNNDEVEVDLQFNFRNKTSEFINLLNSGETLDYMLFYNVFTSACIFIELLLIIYAICKSNIWYTSKKYVKYAAWFSYFWIYVIYIVPLMRFFKLEEEYNHNNTITNQNYLYSYSFTYILYKLLKEIIPLALCFFTSMLWSVSNIKCIFPQNIYIGWLYSYGTIVFYFTAGTLLLVINQLIDNLVFSVGLGIYLFTFGLSNCIYGKRIKYFHKENNSLKKYNYRMGLIKNIGLCSLILVTIVLMFLYDNPLKHGIYKFYKAEIAYFITKIIYKTIFYKILICDTIIAWILNVEKYRDVYKIEMNDFCDRMKYVERQLYEDGVYDRI